MAAATKVGDHQLSEKWLARSRGLRIALVVDSLGGGGAEKVITTLASEFANLGHTPILVVGDSHGPWRGNVSDAVQTLDLAVRNKRALLARRLTASLAQLESDVVLVTGMPCIASVLTAVRLGFLRCPVVVRERSSVSLEMAAARTGRIVRPFRHVLYPAAARVICVSEGARTDFLSTVHYPRHRTHVVYNPAGITTGDLAASVPDHPFFCNPTIPVIMTAGRFAAEKDHFTLLRAFAEARKRRPIRLILLGEGPLRRDLEQLASALKLVDDISLPGYRSDARAFMRHADLFVLSSRFEGMPNALLEALFCGARIVSTDCTSGPREILDNGRYGQLVPVGDWRAMADAILAGLDAPHPTPDPEFMRQFAPERVASAYLDILHAATRRICSLRPNLNSHT